MPTEWSSIVWEAYTALWDLSQSCVGLSTPQREWVGTSDLFRDENGGAQSVHSTTPQLSVEFVSGQNSPEDIAVQSVSHDDDLATPGSIRPGSGFQILTLTQSGSEGADVIASRRFVGLTPRGVVSRPQSARDCVGLTPRGDMSRPQSARGSVASNGSRLHSPRSPKVPRQRRYDGLQLFCDRFLGECIDYDLVQEAFHITSMRAEALELESRRPMMSAFYGRRLDAADKVSMYGSKVGIVSTRSYRSSLRRIH
eukprot:CAMPEP_0179431770 /NCGR_PEP_ID=MMETSP0799-20121207/16581_1 /TAXON_ID=46947 /ORGANISM="Geminigera cryophila, Strain CCMP2564" /LENGTH=253 /DNA_ID=CAMNT_0021208875 /DNA_START=898 /DNA_END=1660 /DNA_ORIENTATION=+